MSRAKRRWTLALVVAAAAWSAVPAPAEWLVTRDGARLEIAGPFEVEGRRVLFELPSGTLGALRLDEVDLEASAALSRAEKAASPPPVAPPPRARLVIDNDDVPKAPPPRPAAESESDGETATRAATPFLDGLEVTSWEEGDSASVGGLEIRGVLANSNDAAASDLSLVVRLYGEDGEEIAASPAFLDGRAVPARRQIGFRALFEGVYSFARAEFEIEATELRLGVASVGK